MDNNLLFELLARCFNDLCEICLYNKEIRDVVTPKLLDIIIIEMRKINEEFDLKIENV